MSRIMQSKTYLGVRVLPPLPPVVNSPSQTGVSDGDFSEDFPPPPPFPPLPSPPVIEENEDEKLVQPSHLLKPRKPSSSLLTIKRTASNPKWKRPAADSVTATQQRLISKGLRMQPPAATLDQTPSNNGDAPSELEPPREPDLQRVTKTNFKSRSPSPRPITPMLERIELPDHAGSLILESCVSSSWNSVESLLRLLEKAARMEDKRPQVIAAVNAADEVNKKKTPTKSFKR